MNTSNKKLAARLRRVESRNVTFVDENFPVFWESAEGSMVRDVEGKSFLDLTSAFGVSSLGHRAPVIQRAMAAQIRKLWHGMGDVHPSRIKVELLEALAQTTPGRLDVSILSSSGAESVESALKTARLATGKPGVIAFQGAYHGLSYGTLGLTDRKEFSAPFRDQLPKTVMHLPFPDSLRGPNEEACLEAIEKFLKNPSSQPSALWERAGDGFGEGLRFGAMLVEPVQGRGGIRVPKPFFLKELKSLARQYSLLFIADEVMTGLGRTGRTFAVEHSGVIPDLLCIGKALANGFPLSACVGLPEVMAAWPSSDGEAIHTNTFLGNPLGCAMALASLKELKSRSLAKKADVLGRWWLEELRHTLGNHPRVGEIRGLGLMIGIEFVKDKKSLSPDPGWTAQIVTKTLQSGLIVLSGGPCRNVLTLTPSLNITRVELSRATKILKEALYEQS